MNETLSLSRAIVASFADARSRYNAKSARRKTTIDAICVKKR
jgi:sulfite reductase beta subunit-like hemoprotein